MDDLFNSCSSLMFLNIINFNTSIIVYSSNMFTGVNENLLYCANLNKMSNIIMQKSGFYFAFFEVLNHNKNQFKNGGKLLRLISKNWLVKRLIIY